MVRQAMAWHNIAYNLLMLLSCSYAVLRGGAPERLVAIIIFVGSVLTAFAAAPWLATFRSLELRLMLVDVVALLAFMAVSQRANRVWPMLVSGLQLAAMGVHIAEIMNGSHKPLGYMLLEALPGWIMIPCLALGTLRHRLRINEYGIDRPWIH